mmetsp:Transcript_8438/g.11001  ORF Transcript_8438/g.11001 Transcript_8438/m.11001 type:complete len:212 (-) Transcript_8438:283-918(-)
MFNTSVTLDNRDFKFRFTSRYSAAMGIPPRSNVPFRALLCVCCDVAIAFLILETSVKAVRSAREWLSRREFIVEESIDENNAMSSHRSIRGASSTASMASKRVAIFPLLSDSIALARSQIWLSKSGPLIICFAHSSGDTVVSGLFKLSFITCVCSESTEGYKTSGIRGRSPSKLCNLLSFNFLSSSSKDFLYGRIASNTRKGTVSAASLIT